MTENNNIPKEQQENLFKVPEGYFDSFEERLSARMAPEPAPSVSWRSMVKPWIGLAAAFLVILMVYNFATQNLFNTSSNQVYTTETSSDVDMWIDELFGTHELLDYFTLKNIESENVDIYPDSLLFGDLTQEEYIFLSHTEY